MTIANDRVPDMEKYPPLPDLFLDNVPYIPWSFNVAEYICMSLSAIFTLIVATHRHRYVHSFLFKVHFLIRLQMQKLWTKTVLISEKISGLVYMLYSLLSDGKFILTMSLLMMCFEFLHSSYSMLAFAAEMCFVSGLLLSDGISPWVERCSYSEPYACSLRLSPCPVNSSSASPPRLVLFSV